MAIPELDGKILITGASGFIGSRLRDRLLASGCDVVALRRPVSPPATAGRSVEADYADVVALERLVAAEKPDYVLHIAGVTKGVTYEDFQLGNVMPTRTLLGAVRDQHPGVKRFVLISSLAAYGPSTTSAPQREENPPHPIEHYGNSKLEAEQVVRDESGGVPWTVLRPSGVYGPRDVDYFNLFKSASKGWNVFFGNRARVMSIIYVDDCIRGILRAAQHPDTIDRGYFLTSDEQVTWEEFQAKIVQAVGGRIRTVNLPEFLVSVAAFGGELATRVDKKPRLLNLQKAKMGAQQAWTCVGDAARRDFGFTAEVNMADGIRRTHEWYASNGWYQASSP
jgi:nucleoside-diphosphate-sugar epimerase